MPFNSTLPANNTNMSATEMRDQLNALNDKIDSLPPPPAESDPVFAASEAANFVPGDKAKLDSALQSFAPPGIAFGVSGDNTVLFPAQPGQLAFSYDLFSNSVAADGSLLMLCGDDLFVCANRIKLNGGAIDSTGQLLITGVYLPGDPAHWAAPAPTTLAEAIDRLAAAVSNNGANPIG